MRRWFSLLLLILLTAMPAAAAQRVLLLPAEKVQGAATSPLNAGEAPVQAEAQQSVQPQAQALETGVDPLLQSGDLSALRAEAGAKGSVRVIVGLRVPFAGEGYLPESERLAQRQEIANAVTALRGRFSAAMARSPEGISSFSSLPFMTMEVTAAELDRLATDPNVITLAKDISFRTADATSNKLINTRGSGAGSVVFMAPSGDTTCSEACSNRYDEDVYVVLSPNAGENSEFKGWSGACNGFAPCVVHMTATRSVTATFESTGGIYAINYTKAGNGEGAVSITTTSGSTVCENACTVYARQGTSVSVTARPVGGSSLASWSGACGGRETCSFTVTGDVSLTGSFELLPIRLTYVKRGKGSGTVTFSPAGSSIDTCRSDCTQRFRKDTLVKVTAIADEGSRFTGWSGACSGRKVCVTTMSRAKTLRATFFKR